MNKVRIPISRNHLNAFASHDLPLCTSSTSDCDCLPMMVDLPPLPISLVLCPEAVHVGVEQDQQKRHQQVEDQPDVNHLHVGSGGEVVAHADKHRRQHQHGRQIHRHNSFKEEILKCPNNGIFKQICWNALLSPNLNL